MSTIVDWPDETRDYKFCFYCKTDFLGDPRRICCSSCNEKNEVAVENIEGFYKYVNAFLKRKEEQKSGNRNDKQSSKQIIKDSA